MKRIIALLLLLCLVIIPGCSRDEQIDQPDVDHSAAEAGEPEPGDDSPPPDSDRPELEHEEFLEQARRMGYTDAQLELLAQSEVPQDTILLLGLQVNPDYFFDKTPDGRYYLEAYYVDGGGEGLLVCVYLRERATDEVTILPDWQNGYSSFGFLDNETFYASIAQVGGADYEAGVRFYRIDRPQTPFSRWDLTDIEEDDPEAPDEKVLLASHHSEESEVLAVFWCEIPKAWGGWVGDDSRNYLVTLLDYEGNALNTIDTGVPLTDSVVGIGTPWFPGSGEVLEAEEDTLYFVVDDILYALALSTGTVRVVE